MTTCNSCGSELHEGDSHQDNCPVCGGAIHSTVPDQVHSEELNTDY